MGGKRKPRRHRRGEGTVYWDVTARRWQAVLRLGTDPRTGKRRTAKLTVPKGGDRRDGDQLLARLQRLYGQRGDVALMRLDDYLRDWLEVVAATRAGSTLAVRRNHVETHIVPMLGAIRVGALHQRDVRRLVRDRLRAGLAPRTVGHVVSTLQAALQLAVEDGDLGTNVARVELPRVEEEPVEAMTPEAAQRILDSVGGHWLGPLWVLLLGTGLRVGEACALDWRDLDLPRPGQPATGVEALTIRHAKGRRARRVPLVPFVVEAMVGHRAAARRVGPDEPVFLGQRTQRRLAVGVASHALAPALRAAGMPGMTPHRLRHGTATLLLAKGVPMRVISEILGHANPALTARVYAHVSEGTAREAMGRLDLKHPDDTRLTEIHARPKRGDA